MRFFCCIDCKTCWQLGGDPKEIQYIIDVLDFEGGRYSCVTPLCQGRLVKVSGTPVGFHQKEIPIRGFYRAIHGFGTGEGKPASVERFTELLRTKKIVDVLAMPAGQPERVILNQLVLEDGTRLHFDSSSRGACCYYIEERGPSCMEVVENELSAVAAAEGSTPDREEVGRDPEVDSESSTELRGPVLPSTTSEQPSTRSVSFVSKADHHQTRSDS